MRRLVRYVLRRGKPVAATGRPKLLLFDFDGTIADTFDAAFTILNQLAVEFKFHPLKPEDLEKARDMRTRQLMKFLKIPMAKMTSIARRGSEEIHARMPEVGPLPGMPELLRELHAAGFQLGVVTSNSEENVRMFFQKYDLELFDYIRCSSKLLGKARELRSVMKASKLSAGEILFVGDETRDVEAAQKAGIRIAAVAWGYNSRRSLEALKPDFLLDKPGELSALLQELK